MTDANGREAGRILYDGFGGVLTSTLPITLTGELLDAPDAATGLECMQRTDMITGKRIADALVAWDPSRGSIFVFTVDTGLD